MSLQLRTNARRKTLAAVIVLGTLLGGCSDIYYDRRETVSLGADDHIAANQAIQMVDPWSRHVGNKNIAFNGERMQAAVERYRHNRVIPPVNATTTSIAQQAAQQAAAGAAGVINQATQQQLAPAAAVK
jgi:hypothetical protein